MTDAYPTKTEAKKKKTPPAAKQHPVHVIREGAVAASIWQRNTAHGMSYLEFTLARSWKSKAGSTGYSQAYFSRNEAELLSVVKQAAAYIAQAEANQPTISVAA